MADRHDAMSERVVPWELRLCALIPLPPFAAGAVIAASLIVGVVALNTALGVAFVVHDADGGVGLDGEFRSAIIVCMLIGYTMAAGRYLAVSIKRDLRGTGSSDGDGLADAGILAGLDHDRAVVVRGRRAGLAGVIALVVMIKIIYPMLAGETGPSLRPEVVWSHVLTPLLGFLLFRAAYNTASGIRSSNAKEVDEPARAPIDLLNLDAYFVNGRIGLRLALVWIVGSSIASLFVFDPNLIVAVAPLLVIGIGLAVVALTLPVRRLHRSIRDAKHRELVAVRARIRSARDAVMQGGDAEAGRLADLLGYQTYLEGLREWPFDNSTVTRFALYLLIPIGSWLGGALVERLLASWLD